MTTHTSVLIALANSIAKGGRLGREEECDASQGEVMQVRGLGLFGYRGAAEG